MITFTPDMFLNYNHHYTHDDCLQGSFSLYSSQAEQLLNLIKHDFFNELNKSAQMQTVTSAVNAGDDTSQADSSKDSQANQQKLPEADGDKSEEAGAADSTSDPDESSTDNQGNDVEPVVIKPPRCLSWYPDNLAWQLEYSRVSIRHNNTLKKLHNFLVSEMESVSFTEHHNVFILSHVIFIILELSNRNRVYSFSCSFLCMRPGHRY